MVLAFSMTKLLLPLLALAISCWGQDQVVIPPSPVTPSTPKESETRINGSGSGVGAGIRQQKREPRKIHYIAVTESRIWTSGDGRIVRASMLAYEPGPLPQGSSKPLTLVRDGKIRLLLDAKKTVSEYPLEKLSKEDQAFVEKQVAARKQAAEKK